MKVFPEVDLGDLGMGVPDGPLGDRPPTARCHDPAKAENRLLGAPEELVDVPLSERAALVVALALDRHPFPARPPSYEVDPDVPAVEAGQLLALRPVGPAPDPVDLEFGLLPRDPHEQLLEPAALFGLIATLGADAVKDLACGGLSSEIKTYLFGHHDIGSGYVCGLSYRSKETRRAFWSNDSSIPRVSASLVDSDGMARRRIVNHDGTKHRCDTSRLLRRRIRRNSNRHATILSGGNRDGKSSA